MNYPETVRSHISDRDVINNVDKEYQAFFSRWSTTKYSEVQKELLFDVVHVLRGVKNKEWGHYSHYFYDRNLELVGPQKNDEAIYAMWLLYMETQT